MYKIDTLTGTGLIFVVIMCLMVITLPRRYAILGLLFSVCYITIGQQLIIAGATFSAIRIVILACWIRLIVRQEFNPIGFNAIDMAFILWLLSDFSIYVLSRLTGDALLNRLGFLYNSIGIYFFLRFHIKNIDDVIHTIRLLAIVILPLGLLMLVEETTQRNLFSIFGGVPEITILRGERLRCQGPFRHPILSGTFGATIAPLFLGLWFNNKLIASTGFISASIIMFTSGSGGPVSAYLLSIAAFALWPFRHNMKVIRRTIVFLLIFLTIFMKAPIWYLSTRISDLLGGTGYWRSRIIDLAIEHFDEWWLFGSDVTAHWMPWAALVPGSQSIDITNQFIAEGLTGGLLSMILFIIILIVCYKKNGQSLHLLTEERSMKEMITVWSLGVALFTHILSFMGISYFDQVIAVYYLSLTMISSTFSSIIAGQEENITI